MGRKMIAVLWALALIVGVAGCAANVPEERLATPSPPPPDPFADADADARELSSKYLGSFSIKPMNYDPFAEGLLVYDGTPIELTFQLEGDVRETNVGMAFFIDGAVQPHQVIRSTQTLDGLRPADELQAVSVHRIAPEETIELTVRFTPTTGKKGETLGFAQMAMFKPLYLPASEAETFGVFQDGHPADYGAVRFEADAPGTVESPAAAVQSAPIPESWKMVMEGNPTGRIQHPQVRLNDGSDDFIPRIRFSGGKVPLRVQLWGGAESDYRATVFVNHVPVEVNGSDSFLIRSRQDQVVSCNFELELPEELPRMNSLYATVLPVGEGYLANPEGGTKTGSILLINEDAPAAEAVPPAGSEAPAPESGNGSAAIETADADLSAALVREGIRSMGPVWLSAIGDDRVLIGLPDRILTLDAASGEILTRTDLEADAGSADELGRELTFRRFDGGFSALVQYYRDPVYQTMLYLYDELSALTRTVPLREFFAIQPDHLSIQCALSASGKKVACTDPRSSGILIRELDSDAAAERIDVGAQTGLSMNYSALTFADGDRFLIFTGVKTEAEAFKSEKAYGIVELESGRVVRVAARDYLEDARIGTAADRVLLNERPASQADFGTGAATLLRFPGCEAEEIPFTHNNNVGLESYTVSLSPSGRYYSGSARELDRDRDVVPLATVWVYDAASLAPVVEAAVSAGSVAELKTAFNESESAFFIAYADAADDWQLHLVRREIP